MNRREFLKSILVGAVATLVANSQIDQIELLLDQTKLLSDNEFVSYVTFTVNMWIHNPPQCVILTGIGADE
jgi:hypothetical protein